MTGRTLTPLLLLVLAGCAPPKPTSVLLVSLDTLRADAVAGMPNLSRLAAEGLSFPRVYSGSNWTLPGHASLLLSQPPSEHRAALTGKPPQPHSTLPAEATLVSEAFATHGYRTFSTTEGGFLDPRFGFGRGFEKVTTVRPLSHDPASEIDRHIDDLVAFVEASGEAPVFAFVHTYRVHDYFLNEPRFQSELLPEDAAWAGKGSLLPFVHRSDGGAPPAQLLHRLYRGAALDADRFLERLLSGLRAADPERRWLISVTSDHGESFVDEPNLRGHGTALVEDQLRVPWIVTSTDPGLREDLARLRPAAVANGIDVGPSLLGFLGIAAPPTFRGRGDLLSRSPSPAEAMLESSFVYGGNETSAPTPNLALIERDRALRSVWRSHGMPTFDCYRREGGVAGLETWRPDPGNCRAFEIVARDRLRAWVAANVTTLPEAGEAPAISDELRAELKALGYL